MSVNEKISRILEKKNRWQSYLAYKYCLDNERRTLEYNEKDDPTFTWRKRGETDLITNYVYLKDYADTLAKRNEQTLIFSDGSRRVC